MHSSFNSNMSFLASLWAHKILVFFILATSGFLIATIVLGVQNADLNKQIDEKDELLKLTTTTTTTTTTTEAPTDPPIIEEPIDMAKYRLPTNAKPESYDLYLYPDLGTGLFRGVISADVTILETTKEVVLHNNKINIDKVSIDGVQGTFVLDEKFELLTIRKNQNADFAPSNKVNVTIEFNGDMKNRIVGLYTSSYTNAQGSLT